jgi:hypothetical protein
VAAGFGLVVGSREWKLQLVGRRGRRPGEPPALGNRSSTTRGQAAKLAAPVWQHVCNFFTREQWVLHWHLILFG